MNIQVNENRLMEFSNTEQGTSNESNIQKLQIEVPEKYNDFFKKIVFVTDDGTFWDYLEEDGSYTLKNNVTKYNSVEFYIWLSKIENEITEDFRSKTYPLFFNENVSPDSEIPEQQETEMERVIRILEEEIEKVKDLETEIAQLKEDVETAIEETNNLNLDVSKVDKTATVILTKKDGTVKTVQISDGVSLQFMWDGTSLGIKTDDMKEYVFVDLQGIQRSSSVHKEKRFRLKKHIQAWHK